MKLRIHGKDSGLIYQDDSITEAQATKFGRLLEYGEYYTIDLDVDPETGSGTCQFVDRLREITGK